MKLDVKKYEARIKELAKKEQLLNELMAYLKSQIALLRKWEHAPKKYHKLKSVCITQEFVYSEILAGLEEGTFSSKQIGDSK